MPRFTLRYRGGNLERDAVALRAHAQLNVIAESGRNFLVDADVPDLSAVMPDPQAWVIAPEHRTPLPPTPHPVIGQLRRI